MTMQVAPDLSAIARALGGDVVGNQVLASGPGHSARDRSLSVWLSSTSSHGFRVFSHAGDDWRACRRKAGWRFSGTYAQSTSRARAMIATVFGVAGLIDQQQLARA